MSQVETQPSTDQRPRPAPDDTSHFFWDAAAERRLVVQRCVRCERLQYPPDACCRHCQAEELEPVELSGRGTIYSYVLVDRPFHVGFVDALPYVVVLVELAEDRELRMVANLVGVPPGTSLACGMPVEVVFEVRGPVTLPQFRLSSASS